MENINFKKFVPYLIALMAFVVISMIYFSPALEGKKLKQGDIDRFKGMSKEITDYKQTSGEQTLWTNNMFSGMPAYFISVAFDGNLMKKLIKFMQLGLPHPANQLFLYFIGFFILLLVMRLKPWTAALGAFAFAFSSYFFIIMEAGHNSKAGAISFMAPVIAGVILTYRGKYLAGGLLTAFFLALEISTNHLQITYYLFLIILVYGIYELVETIRNKKWMHFVKASAFLLVAALLAVGTHATSLMISADHTQYTTRGKSELTFDESNKTSGLDRDYVTQWSYGITETMTLLIPDFMGGASYGEVGENSNTYQFFIDQRLPRNSARQLTRQLPLYWGTQPFTSGPVYVGAIVFFLFFLGLFVVRGKLKWWLLTVTVLAIMLSWGKNMMWFTNFFLDYLPGYNKFRAVSMTLVIAELAIPLLGFLALSKFFSKERDDALMLKGLKYAVAVIGGVLLIILAVPGMLFDFNSAGDIRYLQNLNNAGLPEQMNAGLLDALIADRIRILRIDTFRSLIFILLTAGTLWLFLKKKIKMAWALAILSLLVLIDMWAVNKRYLNNDNFERKAVVENPYQPSNADKEIMRDAEDGFRVLNLTVDPFSDASTSYFHHSVGGYHGAKLKRYQELIDYQISPEISRLYDVLRSQTDMQLIQQALQGLHVLNMLNTKYFIIMASNGPIPLQNPYAMGPAWFVEEYELADNADEEITGLGDIDPAVTALIDKRFAEYVEGKTLSPNSGASIELTEYKPNHLTYSTRSSGEQLAVFSEVYYPNGWTAYIDGEEMPHFRANWILRAMMVPAGEHSIEFKFQPKLYATGETISLASSVLLLLLVVVYAVLEVRKKL